MKKRNTLVLVNFCLLFPFYMRKTMFAILHSDINYPKSGLLHLTNQPYCKKSRTAKVKDGITNLILKNYLLDQYTFLMILICRQDSYTLFKKEHSCVCILGPVPFSGYATHPYIKYNLSKKYIQNAFF
jgi:hypothetical protein